MKNTFLLLVLETVNVLVEDWLKLLDVVNVHLEVHKPMAESCVTIRQLQVELCVLESCPLDLQYLLDYLLV